MSYTFNFGALMEYADLFWYGIFITLSLTAISSLLGGLIGVAGAAASFSDKKWLRAIIYAYVEFIRNTPFLVQLFFVFFALPNLGFKINEIQAAILAMSINLGAYALEIIRAGILSVPVGQKQAATALGIPPTQIFLKIILPQALANVFPSLVSQVLIVMLGSAVVSQISVQDLTYAANFVQSRNFLSFEVYLLITVIYLLLAIAVRYLLNLLGAKLLFKGKQA